MNYSLKRSPVTTMFSLTAITLELCWLPYLSHLTLYFGCSFNCICRLLFSFCLCFLYLCFLSLSITRGGSLFSLSFWSLCIASGR